MSQLSYSEIKAAIKETRSMTAAAALLKVHFNTFKRYALKFDLYSPNRAGKGIKKKSGKRISLKEILEGKHPQYQSYKLKKKLFVSGLKTNSCERCGISEWCNHQLNCELDHIDGDRTNHKIENLRILCPNCHSQTSTFRSKNIRRRTAN